MKICLTIDPGYKSGIAAGHIDPQTGVVTVSYTSAVTMPTARPKRLQACMDALTKARDTVGAVQVAVIEHPVPIYGDDGEIRNRKGYDTQISDMGTWQNACQLVCGVWPEEIYPPTWQSKIKVGRGKAASLACVHRMGHDVEDHNVADAILMLYWCVQAKGVDPDEITIPRRPNESDVSYQRRVDMHRRIVTSRGMSAMQMMIIGGKK